MPSSNNNNKNKKKRGGNFTGLITLIAWALFLTVIINFMANYSLRGNNAQRSTRAEIVYTDFLDMIRSGEVASVSFTDELINITPVDGYIYVDENGSEVLRGITGF